MDASEWDLRYEAFDGSDVGEPGRWVVDVLASVVPGRALDLAAGDGRYALWLAGQGWDVTAVDFSPVALARLTDHAGRTLKPSAGRITTVEADLVGFVPEQSAYDLVLIANLHLPAPALTGVVDAAAAALVPGGLLILVGHDRESAGRGVGGPPDLELLWTCEELAAIADRPALSVISVEQVVRAVVTDDGTAEAIDTALIARRNNNDNEEKS